MISQSGPAWSRAADTIASSIAGTLYRSSSTSVSVVVQAEFSIAMCDVWSSVHQSRVARVNQGAKVWNVPAFTRPKGPHPILNERKPRSIASWIRRRISSGSAISREPYGRICSRYRPPSRREMGWPQSFPKISHSAISIPEIVWVTEPPRPLPCRSHARQSVACTHQAAECMGRLTARRSPGEVSRSRASAPVPTLRSDASRAAGSSPPRAAAK